MSENNAAMVRMLEAASAVLEGAPEHALNAVQFNKAMFYFDLVCLSEDGETATGAMYLALHQGPFLSKEDKLVKQLAAAGIAKQAKDGNKKPIALIKPMPEYSFLTEKQRARAREAGGTFGKYLSSIASQFSHANIGWQVAYEAGLKAHKPPQPINMLLALQQLDDEEDDGWMQAPADQELKKTIAALDQMELVEW